MIARGPATPDEAGRSCPYCRFPLETGVEVARCPECEASHHAECWDANHGCAVVLCAAGPAQAVDDRKKAAAAASARPAPPPPPRKSRAGLLAGIGGGLAVLVIVLLVAAGSDGGGGAVGPPYATETPFVPESDLTVEPEVTVEPEPTTEPEPTGLSEQETTYEVADLLTRSAEGRAAAMNGDLDAANAIRGEVLGSIDLLDTQELSEVLGLLAQAMQASIDANNARAECGDECAAELDELASTVKVDLVNAYNEYAEYWEAPLFGAEEI